MFSAHYTLYGGYEYVLTQNYQKSHTLLVAILKSYADKQYKDVIHNIMTLSHWCLNWFAIIEGVHAVTKVK